MKRTAYMAPAIETIRLSIATELLTISTEGLTHDGITMSDVETEADALFNDVSEGNLFDDLW